MMWTLNNILQMRQLNALLDISDSSKVVQCESYRIEKMRIFFTYTLNQTLMELKICCWVYLLFTFSVDLGVAEF